MVHLYKSFKEALCNNKTIKLSDDIVGTYNLPSNTVRFDHIRFVSEYQEEMDLKFVPKLDTKELQANHFRKMYVPNANCVMNDKVAATLDLLAYCGDAEEECRTTAWFIRKINRWFKLVTSRSLSLALSRHNEDAYIKAIQDLKFVVTLMENVDFGEWKVVQTHIIMATKSILAIQEILLSKSGYNYLMLGRFLQDLVENIFSILRAICATPSALQFKYSLKRIVLGQFSFHVRKSCYGADDRLEAVGLRQLLQSAKQAEVPMIEDTVRLPSWEEPPQEESFAEACLFYRQCGYTISTLMKKKILKCETCLFALKHHGPVPHPLSTFTKLTNFSANAQIEVSHNVYVLLRRIEFNLLRWKGQIKDITHAAAKVVMKNIPQEIMQSSISPCHPLTEKILYSFINSRVKMLSKQFQSGQVEMAPSSFGSKSMGKKLLADNLKIVPKRKKTIPQADTQEKAKRKRLIPEAVSKRLMM